MARRGNGEGTISRRKDGLYMARYTANTSIGKRRRTIYAKTRKEVSEKLSQALADRGRGLVFDEENLKVEEYLERWLSDSVRDTVRENTYSRYEQITRTHLIPTLGKVKLKTLSPAHVRGLYREKLDGRLSPRTVQYIHVTLHKALKQAVMDGLIPRNATEAVKAPRPAKKETHPLVPDQVRALLSAANEAGDRLEALYVVAVHTGMRQGELLGLKWEDVDLSAGTLQVRRTYSSGSFQTPKTAKSRRSVRLTAAAVEALRRHRTAQNEERLKIGSLWTDQGLVFPNQSGEPMHSWILIDAFKKLLKRAELPEIRFHDLRHTCASLLLLEGVHPKYVQELLGHATISITLDTYSHVLPGMSDQAAKAMERALI